MSKLTKSAWGRQCTVRLPGVCNWNPETTVLAHMNGAGIGLKDKDLFACYACSDCHSWLDGGWANMLGTRAGRDLAHLQAVIETQRIWLEEGLISFNDVNNG